MHYKLQIEHFDKGAKLFNRGQECECIMIIVNGEVELFVEQGGKDFILDTLGIGSTIG
jgi:CRP-like cAMP-binding protein